MDVGGRKTKHTIRFTFCAIGGNCLSKNFLNRPFVSELCYRSILHVLHDFVAEAVLESWLQRPTSGWQVADKIVRRVMRLHGVRQELSALHLQVFQPREYVALIMEVLNRSSFVATSNQAEGRILNLAGTRQAHRSPGLE
jgi:hypothetical protein